MSGTFLIVGAPGNGKTTFVASGGTPQEPLLFLDMDNKLHKMVNLQQKLKEGSILQWPITEPLSTIGIRRLVIEEHKQGGSFTTSRPKGYLQLVDYIEKLEKDKCIVSGKKVGVALDSYTTVNEHIKRLLLQANNKSTMTQPLYGALLTNFEELNNTLLRLPTNVFIIAHEEVTRDEISGEVSYRPLIEGQMKFKIAKDFEEVYWCVKDVKQGKAEYWIDPIGGKERQARTSRSLASNKIEPDLLKILKMEG